jgi:hypothetical protein
MPRRNTLAALTSLALAASAAALVAVAPLAPSRAESPPAGLASSPSLSSSAAVSASASAPRLADDPPPRERSPAPKADEWASGKPTRFERPLPAPCSAVRVREWVRVTCHQNGIFAGTLAGPPEGFWAGLKPPEERNPLFTFQFPVRPGERRLVQIKSGEIHPLYQVLNVSHVWFLSIQWNDGEPPLLVPQL